MDQTHQEFVHLVNLLDEAGKDIFMELFIELVEHTERHFQAENELMEDSPLPAIREHMDEHPRVTGEMNRLARMVDSGSFTMARAFVHERLPDWFNLHTQTMDSALAAHLNPCGLLPGGR
jgi:hemerythrin-like metal-binding protein